MSFLVFIRFITCVTIIVMGKMTIRLRNESEANRPSAMQPHGTEAERMDVIIKLSRSVKDVFKLNIWTCVFVLPMAISTLILIVYPEASNKLFRLNFLSSLLYFISNPIIYSFNMFYQDSSLLV